MTVWVLTYKLTFDQGAGVLGVYKSRESAITDMEKRFTEKKVEFVRVGNAWKVDGLYVPEYFIDEHEVKE